MRCTCGKTIEPAYEQTGRCEDCYADGWAGNNAKVYKSALNPDIVVSDLPKEEALLLPVSDLGLNLMTTNKLASIGILYVKDLVRKTEAEIIDIPGFGKKTLISIIESLEDFDLSLLPA